LGDILNSSVQFDVLRLTWC